MVIPIGCSNDTMFPPDPFNLSSYTEQCNSEYGVPPRPHWVTTYFGGHVHIDSLLRNFFVASHIVFTSKIKTNILKFFMANLILHRFV